VAILLGSLSSQVPPQAAPELSDYPQFTACKVPGGSGATKAYKGFIRPYSDDATARRVLQAIEENLRLEVSGGRLDASPPAPKPHPYRELLIGMAAPCTVLVLEFAGSEHARTFLLDPPMIPRLSQSPHLRLDKSIKIDGASYPALCVYSGSLHRFEDGRSRLEQLLDQTATYLAKYIVWLRTRKLYQRTREGPQIVRSKHLVRNPTAADLLGSPDLLYAGYWPGHSAPSGPAAHLATIRPDEECWCWTGKRYGECCRPRESTIMAELESQQLRVQFVHELMAAVRLQL
jgi:hypothetical protein